MISLLAKPENGSPTTQEMYRKRLHEVLGDGKEASECCPAGSLELSEAVPESLESAAGGEPVPEADGQVCYQDPTLTDDSAQREQNAGDSSEEVELGQAARQIADTLVGTLGRAIQDVHRRVAINQRSLEAASETMIRLSGEIRQVSTEVSTLLTRVEPLAPEQTRLGSRLTELNGRLSEEEVGSKQTQERLDKLFAGQEAAMQQVQACTGTLSALEARMSQLCERLETLDAGLQAQTATKARLTSLCEKLDELHRSLAERVDFHEELIHVLRAEVRQPVGMVERILGSLRVLDLRQEARFPVDEPATVVVEGQPETVMAGRVVDASENGLGLVLETPLPPAEKVRIDVSNTSRVASVAYCLPKGEKYAVGLKLSQPLHGRAKDTDRAM